MNKYILPLLIILGILFFSLFVYQLTKDLNKNNNLKVANEKSNADSGFNSGSGVNSNINEKTGGSGGGGGTAGAGSAGSGNLSEIMNKVKDKIVLIPIAADMGLVSTNNQIEQYNIDRSKFPVVIIDEKHKFYELEGLKDIEPLII